MENTIVAGEPMTKEELAVATKRVEGKKSPFDPKTVIDKEGNKTVIKGTPVKPAKVSGTLTRVDGSKVTNVGNFKSSPEVGDSQTLKKFKRIMPNFNKPVMIMKGIGDDAEQLHCKWIPMTTKEALAYQGVLPDGRIDREKAILLGYDEDHQMGLLEVSAIQDNEDNQEEI